MPSLTPQALGLTKAAYTVPETLSLISLGRTRLYGAIKSGDLRPTRLGRRTLITAVDICAFLNKFRNETETLPTSQPHEGAA